MASRVTPKRFVRLQAQGSEILNRVQSNIEQSVASIIALPYMDGVLLEDVSLTYGERNDVAHSLGRRPKGWFVVKQKGVHSAFYAYHDGGSAQSISASTDTLLELDSELYDDSGDFDTSTYLFTAPVTARYDFDGMFSLASDADIFFGCNLFINGSLSYLGTYYGAPNPAAHTRSHIVRSGVPLSEGDTVGLRGYHASAAAKSLTGGSTESYLSGRISGELAPIEDSTVSSDFDNSSYVPLWVGRPSTASLWVF